MQSAQVHLRPMQAKPDRHAQTLPGPRPRGIPQECRREYTVVLGHKAYGAPTTGPGVRKESGGGTAVMRNVMVAWRSALDGGKAVGTMVYGLVWHSYDVKGAGKFSMA
jgi:hypothetical protein